MTEQDTLKTDQPATIQQRSVALHATIGQLLSGVYEQRPGWEPNVVKIGEKEISRAHIIGTIVAMPEGQSMTGTIEQLQFTLDDGTGSISVRSYEPIYSHKELTLGSPILVIGKPREYQNELFVSAEIIRVVDKKWLAWRKNQLDHTAQSSDEERGDSDQPAQSQSLADIIDALDTGDGVSVDDLKAKMGDDVETRINKLLMVGEAYEIRPGKIKVLK